MAAFPLGSFNALALAPIVLEARNGSEPSALWDATEAHFARYFRGVSIDVFIYLRDQLWFSRDNGVPIHGPVRLVDYVENVAKTFLTEHGAFVHPRIERERYPEDGEHGYRARRRWRWMSLSLPPDMLIAARGPICSEIDLMAPVTRQLLYDKGYAETHFHVGAAFDFNLLWVGALWQAGQQGFRADRAYQSRGADLRGGREIGEYILRAALSRLLLAQFLRHSAGSCSPIPFWDFVGQSVDHLCDRATFALLREALVELQKGQLNPGTERPGARYERLRLLYSRLSDQARVTFKLRRGDVDPYELDPIQHLGILRWTSGTPEMAWLRAGFAYLKQPTADPQVARLFWQTVRVRCLYYRYLVQRPLTPGLLWFVRHFRRLAPSRTPLTRFIFDAAMKSGGSSDGLRSLEIRTSPGDTLQENRKSYDLWAKAFQKGKQGTVEEFGIVLHFTKERSQGEPGAFGKDSHADPNWSHNRGTRYSSIYRSRHQQARAVSKMVLAWPEALSYLRGLDLCTDELGTPGWVFVPLFRYVREAAEQSAAYLGEIRYPLRVTIHAGEDFVHLAGGLRRIDESIRYFNLREGDRLGHAVALGVDPVAWADDTGPILMSREERLWDLLWMYSFSLRQEVSFLRDTLSQIERDLSRLSSIIFGEPVSLPDLEELYDSLYCEQDLLKVGYPSVDRASNQSSEKLRRLASYLTDPQIFARGQELEWVRYPRFEAENLIALQEKLRQMVSRHSITIEINPTSNLLVGNLADILKHPLWRLKPPLPRPDLSPVKVCIGSDDPSVFATRLPEEYQLLMDALIAGGCPEPEALAWLDQVRAASLSSRFTLSQGIVNQIKGKAFPGPPLHEPRWPPI